MATVQDAQSPLKGAISLPAVTPQDQRRAKRDKAKLGTAKRVKRAPVTLLAGNTEFQAALARLVTVFPLQGTLLIEGSEPTNAEQSPLLRLPAELRVRIYE